MNRSSAPCPVDCRATQILGSEAPWGAASFCLAVGLLMGIGGRTGGAMVRDVARAFAGTSCSRTYGPIQPSRTAWSHPLK